MGARRLVLRIIVATVMILVAGVFAVFGFQILEPMLAGFGEPAPSLGWGEPGAQALNLASFGFLGVLLVVIIWFVSAPIRNDVRQQTR